MGNYEVWHVESDGTYSPVSAPALTSKAKAVKLAKALAKSAAFSDSVTVDVKRCGEVVAEFRVKAAK